MISSISFTLFSAFVVVGEVVVVVEVVVEPFVDAMVVVAAVVLLVDADADVATLIVVARDVVAADGLLLLMH